MLNRATLALIGLPLLVLVLVMAGCGSDATAPMLRGSQTSISLHTQDADQVLVQFPTPYSKRITMSADGMYPRIAAVGSYHSDMVCIYSFANGNEQTQIRWTDESTNGVEMRLEGLAVSPDGAKVAVVVGTYFRLFNDPTTAHVQQLRLYDPHGALLHSAMLPEAVSPGHAYFLNVAWNASGSRLILSSSIYFESHLNRPSGTVFHGLLVEADSMKLRPLPVAHARFVGETQFIAIDSSMTPPKVALLKLLEDRTQTVRTYGHSAPHWSDPVSGKYLVHRPMRGYRMPRAGDHFGLYENAEQPRLISRIFLENYFATELITRIHGLPDAADGLHGDNAAAVLEQPESLLALDLRSGSRNMVHIACSYLSSRGALYPAFNRIEGDSSGLKGSRYFAWLTALAAEQRLQLEAAYPDFRMVQSPIFADAPALDHREWVYNGSFVE